MINTKYKYLCLLNGSKYSMCKQFSSDSFKNTITFKLLTYKSYL